MLKLEPSTKAAWWKCGRIRSWLAPTALFHSQVIDRQLFNALHRHNILMYCTGSYSNWLHSQLNLINCTVHVFMHCTQGIEHLLPVQYIGNCLYRQLDHSIACAGTCVAWRWWPDGKEPSAQGESELLDAGTRPTPLIIVTKSIATFHWGYLSRSTTLFPYFSSALCTW